MQNEEIYHKAIQGMSAKQVEQFIKDRFNSAGGFGDMFTEEEIEKINFLEIQTA